MKFWWFFSLVQITTWWQWNMSNGGTVLGNFGWVGETYIITVCFCYWSKPTEPAKTTYLLRTSFLICSKPDQSQKGCRGWLANPKNGLQFLSIDRGSLAAWSTNWMVTLVHVCWINQNITWIGYLSTPISGYFSTKFFVAGYQKKMAMIASMNQYVQPILSLIGWYG